MKLIFAMLAAAILLAASPSPAALSAEIKYSPPIPRTDLFMQAEECFMNLPIIGCVKQPITLEFVNAALLNTVKPWVQGLSDLLDQYQNSDKNFLSLTPDFWDLEVFQGIRFATLFIAYAAGLKLIGFWTAIKMLFIELLKHLGFSAEFIMESEEPEGTFIHFLIGAFAPAVLFGTLPWMIELTNQFSAALNVSLKDVLLPPQNTDSFLILAATAIPYFIFDLLIGASLGFRFLFLVIATLASVLAAVWIFREDTTDLFQMFITLWGILNVFQLGVMGLLWFYLAFVKEFAGGNGITFAHVVFLGGLWYLILKSRPVMGYLVMRAGLHRLQFWSRSGAISASVA